MLANVIDFFFTVIYIKSKKTRCNAKMHRVRDESYKICKARQQKLHFGLESVITILHFSKSVLLLVMHSVISVFIFFLFTIILSPFESWEWWRVVNEKLQNKGFY